MSHSHDVMPVPHVTDRHPVAHLLLRDGIVVGCALLIDDRLPFLHAAWRTPNGRVACQADYIPTSGSRSEDVLSDWWRWKGPDQSPKSGGFAAFVVDGSLLVEAQPSAECDLRPLPEFVRRFASYVVRETTGDDDGSDAYRDAFSAVLRAVVTVLRTFVETLDPEAVAFASSRVTARRADEPFHLLDGSDCGLSAVWSGLDATFTPEAPLRSAITGTPGFDEILKEGWAYDARSFAEVSRTRGSDEVLSWVLRERGLSTRDVRVAHAAAAALGRLSADPHVQAAAHRCRMSSKDHAVEVAVEARRHPASWTPRTDEEWSALATVALLRRHLPRFGTDWTTSSLFRSGGRWQEHVAKLCEASGRCREALPQACDDVEDVVRAFAEQVVLPLSLTDEDPPTSAHTHVVAAGMLFGRDPTLIGILRTSRAWHVRRVTVDAVIAALPGSGEAGVSWSAGLPDSTCAGREVVVLTTRARLVDEGASGTAADGGEGLSHCVGGYVSRCVTEGLRIVSLRVPDASPPVRTSTAALRLVEGRLVVVQHHGRGNADPPVSDVRALLAYVGDVEAGRLHVDHDGLRPRRMPRSDLPYAATSENVAAVVDAWRPFLPRRFRRMDVAGLRAAVSEGGHSRTSGENVGDRHAARP